MASVYALSSSLEPDIVRYVGRTKADTADKRLYAHVSEAKRNKGRKRLSSKFIWIQGVLKCGGSITALVLESGLSLEESGLSEVWFIAWHRAYGYPLVNMNNGGNVSGLVRH